MSIIKYVTVVSAISERIRKIHLDERFLSYLHIMVFLNYAADPVYGEPHPVPACCGVLNEHHDGFT